MVAESPVREEPSLQSGSPLPLPPFRRNLAANARLPSPKVRRSNRILSSPVLCRGQDELSRLASKLSVQEGSVSRLGCTEEYNSNC